MSTKRQAFWIIISIFLAILTILGVFIQARDVSVFSLIERLRQSDFRYLSLSVALMFFYIFCEGEAIICMGKAAGFRSTHKNGFLYGSADIYFSAVTPSAVGGQPASAYFMHKDGIPGEIATAILLLNLIMYTLAMQIVGLVCFCIRPHLFFTFTIFSRIVIVASFLVLCALLFFFFLLLIRPGILFGAARVLVALFSRIRLIRHPTAIYEKLEKKAADYSECVDLFFNNKLLLFKIFLYNLLQRLSNLFITVTMYLATGGAITEAVDLFVVQSLVVVGSNCIPLPGAMGVADMLMIDGYTNLFNRTFAYELELLGRSMSFYVCSVLSGFTVLVGWILKRKKEQ